MNEFLQVMTLPLLACLILAGIHAYLGVHVIEREVIFVDLALAQVAAFGSSLALIGGFDLHGPEAYWFSLGFTIAGAAVFSMARLRRQVIPQEAVIGIVYAVSAAALVVVLSRSGEGDEHIRESLVGNILLVQPAEVMKLAAVYSAIGWFHWVFRKPFFLITRDVEAARASGLRVRWWDFLFYASFGIVVTSSVRVAGVLLVFSFLIVPAAIAVLFAKKTSKRLLWGWSAGVAASVVGLTASYWLDLPTGASVVCAFGVLLALAVGVKKIVL